MKAAGPIPQAVSGAGMSLAGCLMPQAVVGVGTDCKAEEGHMR